LKLEKIRNFELMLASLTPDIWAQVSSGWTIHLAGVQFCVWVHHTKETVDMAWPRLLHKRPGYFEIGKEFMMPALRRRILERLKTGAALCLVVCATIALPRPISQEKSRPEHESGAVQVQMRNVMYHYTDNIAVHILRFGGELVPTTSGRPPVFDDKNSFSLHIAAAEISLDTKSLANVLNTNVFAGKDAPLKDISVGIEGGRLKVKGKLHKHGDISFETVGQLSATGDGRVRLHMEKIKAMHLPLKGLMDLFGLDIADLIKTGKVQGVEVDKDDLILDTGKILPPPRIAGRVTEVRLEGNNIVQVFGAPQKFSWSRSTVQNYMAYHGNKLQFGKLTMADADMVLIDPDPKDPFDFYLDRYKDQLVAGYSKTTRENGLRVYMVDFNKLNRKISPPAEQRRQEGQPSVN
jgi:hypothetical protein